jgi:hypothetical protein
MIVATTRVIARTTACDLEAVTQPVLEGVLPVQSPSRDYQTRSGLCYSSAQELSEDAVRLAWSWWDLVR